MRRDDSTLSPDSLVRVRKEAERILTEADAMGRFPTPVSDIVSAAGITISPENVLDEGFLSRMRSGAGRALKSAISKVLGLLDVRDMLVFIDHNVHSSRQVFLKLHETGHGFLPWQRESYLVVEDGDRELDPDVADLFEREANVFAIEVLFQLDSFRNEAADYPFGINVPLRLSRRYGGSVYSAIRRYVATSHLNCAVLVFNLPEFAAEEGLHVTLRRSVKSKTFENMFRGRRFPEVITPSHSLWPVLPLDRRMTRPREIVIKDCNNQRRKCLAEAFTNRYQIFVLVHVVETLNRVVMSSKTFGSIG